MDLIRVIGIFAIIVGHIWYGPAVQTFIYSWHVPIFFILSGYLWKSGRSIGTELSSRWLSLGRPYVAWLALIGSVFLLGAFLDSGWRAAFHSFLRMLAGGSWIGRPFSAFWFFGALVAAAIWVRLFQRRPLWGLSLSLVVMAAGFFYGEQIALVPLSAAIGVACAVYVYAGMFFRRIAPRLPRPTIFGIGLILVGIPIAYFSDPMDLKNGDFGTPVMAVLVSLVICFGIILLAEQSANSFTPGFASTITALAACGLTVVLIHTVPFWLLAAPEDNPWLALVVSATVSWLVAVILARTPLAGWLTGKAAQRVASGKLPA